MQFRAFVNWLDALACFATAAAVVAYYGFGIDQIQLGALQISLVQHGKFIAGAWVLLEILSPFVGQGGNNPLYWLDYLGTWVAWLFINLTALYVWIGLTQGYPDVVRLLQVPYAKELLIGLVISSWISALLLQGSKHGRAWQEAQVQRAVQPAPPQPPAPPPAPAAPPQPAQAGGGFVLTAIVLVIVAVILALAFFGGGVVKMTAEDTDVKTAEELCRISPGTTVYVPGTGTYKFTIDCPK